MDLSRWNPFKPFTRSRSEVAWYLEAAVNNTLDCGDWDTFLSIPIKGAPEMEAIRASCEALQPFETIRDDGKMSFSPEAMATIRDLLQKVKNDV